MPFNSSVFDVLVKFGLNASQFNAQLAQVGAAMQRTGRTMTTALTLPIVAFGVNSLRVAGNFEQAMNQVAAVSGATGEQFDALRESAMELGRTTQFSASEAAAGMSFLAMAGFEVEEIIGAMPATLNLAAAAQIDLGRAADIASNILTGYGQDVDQLGSSVDVMVELFTSANTDLLQLGEAMKVAGPVAHGLGMDFEETAAMLGLMGNAGIQGSLAGTALRGVLQRLAAGTPETIQTLKDMGVTVFDAAGNMNSLTSMVMEFESTGATMVDFIDIFGRFGGAFAAAASQGSGALTDLMGELEDSSGRAAEVAERQMEGLNGAVKLLMSAFEGLNIAIGDAGLLKGFTDLVGKVTEWVQVQAEADPEQLNLALKIGAIVAAIGPLLLVLGHLVAIAPAVGTALSIMFGPWGLLVAAVVAGIALLIQNWETIGPRLQPIADWFLEMWQEVSEWFIQQMPMLAEVWQSLLAFFQAIWAEHGTSLTIAWTMTWETFKNIVSIAWSVIKALWSSFWAAIKLALDLGTALITGDWETAWDGIKDYAVTIWETIKTFISETLTGVLDLFNDFFGGVLDGWANFYDELVGNSIIPDANALIVQNFEETFSAIEARTEDFVKNTVDTLTGLFSGSVSRAGIGNVTLAQRLVESILDNIVIGVDRIGPFSTTTAVEELVSWMQDNLIQGVTGGRSFRETTAAEQLNAQRRTRGEAREEGAERREREKELTATMKEVHEALLDGFKDLGRSIISGDISKAIAGVFSDLGKILSEHISTRITAQLPGAGLLGGIVGALGGGLVQGFFSLFGGRKQPGETKSTPSYTFITNWEDFYQFGASLPASFFLSGRGGGIGLDAHGRTFDVAWHGWETGEHFDI